MFIAVIMFIVRLHCGGCYQYCSDGNKQNKPKQNKEILIK